MTHKDVLLGLLSVICIALAWLLIREYRRRLRREGMQSVNRILFPFDERTFSHGALEAAIRIARAEHAELTAIYLAVVSLRVSLEAALPRHAARAMPLLDEIESLANQRGVPFNSGIEPGRTYQHALKNAYSHTDFDRVVVAAKSDTETGFNSADVAWMLDHTATELLVLKAAPGAHQVLIPA